MYCVVVSMWWVMSPVKMNPGRSNDQMEKHVTVSNHLQNSSRLLLVKSVQHLLQDQNHTSRCYGNLPQVMSIKRKVKRQGDPLQRQHRGTQLDILKQNFKLTSWFLDLLQPVCMNLTEFRGLGHEHAVNQPCPPTAPVCVGLPGQSYAMCNTCQSPPSKM